MEQTNEQIEVRTCPVCGGNGLVPNGFYNRTSDNWSTISTTLEVCRSCYGKGYVQVLTPTK